MLNFLKYLSKFLFVYSMFIGECLLMLLLTSYTLVFQLNNFLDYNFTVVEISGVLLFVFSLVLCIKFLIYRQPLDIKTMFTTEEKSAAEIATEAMFEFRKKLWLFGAFYFPTTILVSAILYFATK